MTRHIGKNINLFLLVVIIICVVNLVIVSSYFTKRSEIISRQYSNISNELRAKSNELIAAKNELLLLKGNLNQTNTDVRKYDELYTEKVDEAKKLSTELADEQANSLKLSSELQKSTANVASLQRDKIQLEDKVKKEEVKFDSCMDSLAKWEDCESKCDSWAIGQSKCPPTDSSSYNSHADLS